ARDTPQSEADLGKGLALLHQQTSHTFGLNHNNFIGSTTQINTPETNWLDFFSKHRLQAQFQLAEKNGFYYSFQQEAEALLQALPCLLEGHQPKPCLLHGDLWSGNKGTDTNNNPIIFDPAVYYGDRECDLAMTELFGGFSETFYAAYEDVYPLEQGYQQRKELYNLYHILNHANLFGGSYIQQSKSIMLNLINGIAV
ncbi:MAG: fructosamine kinase family protein, partial [Ghiorsea sp.]